jgi:hypothetical protein
VRRCSTASTIPGRRARSPAELPWCDREPSRYGLSLKEPSRERSEKQTKKATAKLGEGEKRIVADDPEHIHTQVRVKCLQRDVLVCDYILELLAKDGIK